MKAERQRKILEIIDQQAIDSQEDLIRHLQKFGIHATQTTISRDIKELRIIKSLSEDGTFRYLSPYAEKSAAGKLGALFSESVLRIIPIQSIVAIQCQPAMAQAVCAAMDKVKLEDIVATLAGDDTIFALCRDDIHARMVARKLTQFTRKR